MGSVLAVVVDKAVVVEKAALVKQQHMVVEKAVVVEQQAVVVEKAFQKQLKLGAVAEQSAQVWRVEPDQADPYLRSHVQSRIG